jgi:hypothetical protein
MAVVGFDTILLVLDDGLGVWSLDDATEPALLTHTDLFGPDPVSTARLLERNGAPQLLAAGGNPGRVTAIDIADPSNPGIGAEIALPGLSGEVTGLAGSPDGTLVLLTSEGDTSRLFRFDISEPAAPVLLAETVLPPGPPAVAVDVGCPSADECAGSGFVAVVRKGRGVEIFSEDILVFTRAVDLSGFARDVVVVPGVHPDVIRTLVALGYGEGLAVITGLPDAPVMSHLHSPGDVLRVVRRAVWGGEGWRTTLPDEVDLLTPGGMLVQSLQHRRWPESEGSN